MTGTRKGEQREELKNYRERKNQEKKIGGPGMKKHEREHREGKQGKGIGAGNRRRKREERTKKRRTKMEKG